MPTGMWCQLSKRRTILIVWALAAIGTYVGLSNALAMAPDSVADASAAVAYGAIMAMLVLVATAQLWLIFRTGRYFQTETHSWPQHFEVSGPNGWIGAECRRGLPALSTEQIQGLYARFVSWQDECFARAARKRRAWSIVLTVTGLDWIIQRIRDIHLPTLCHRAGSSMLITTIAIFATSPVWLTLWWLAGGFQ